MKKNIVKTNEAQHKKIVAESVKKLNITTEDALEMLEDDKDYYDLEGVELTEDDAEYMLDLIKKGMTTDSAIDTVLSQIRETLDNGLDEMSNKKKSVIRLNESQLKKIISESVKKVLNEGYYGNEKMAQLITNAYNELQKKPFPHQVSTHAWNIGMRLYWEIEKLKNNGIEGFHADDDTNDDGYFQDETFAKMERDDI